MIVPVVLLVSVFASVVFFSVKYMLTPGISSSKSDVPVSNLCNLSTNQNCNLKDMESGYPSYLVKPDKSVGTYCIDNSPYQFEVIKGATNKLMISFQGGGVGWDELTLETLPRISSKFCKRSITKQDPYGIYDISNSNNAFKDYTIVNVLYCSGDLHAGEATRKFGWFSTTVVQQTGYKNTMTTLNWIQSQIDGINGYLDPNLDNLVISGQSAGAIGAQLWSDHIIEKFNAKNKVVIIDSYLGVIPEEAGPIIKGFNFCIHAKDLFPSFATICNDNIMKPDFLQTVATSSMKAHPTVPFTFIQSKLDIFQIGFYELIKIDSWHPNNKLEGKTSADPLFPTLKCYYDLFAQDTFEEFLVCVANNAKVSTKFEDLEKDILVAYGKVTNFHAYLVDGGTHTFTNKIYYNTTDPSGKTPSPPTPPGGCVMLDTWLNALITTGKGPSASMCIADSENFCPDFIPSCDTLPTATPVHDELR